MEANVIKCPNCGAGSTNHTNCEYCGSLLVRFVDKGIDLSTTSYLTNDEVYAGLIDALKQNLDRQELSDSAVETGIFYKSSPTVKLSRKRHGVATVFRSGSTTWSDGDPIKLGDKNRGLVIKFSFDIHAEGDDVSDERIERQHQEFKSLGSFPLFTPHTGIYMRPGSSSRFRSQEYAIDFGEDVEGAARLISEVLSKVYGIPEDAQLIYLGEEEQTVVEKKEEKFEKEEVRGYTLWQKIGIGITIAILFFLLLGTLGNGGVISSILIICALAVAIYAAYKRETFNGILLMVMPMLVFFGCFVLMCSTSAVQDEEAEQLKEKWKQEEKQDASPKQDTPQKEKDNNDVEMNAKKDKGDQRKSILDNAYASGVNDAREPEFVENVRALIQGGYSKDRIETMQKQQGRLNYKEEYGEPKNSEEESLMNLYGDKYAEGFMKTLFKN